MVTTQVNSALYLVREGWPCQMQMAQQTVSCPPNLFVSAMRQNV